MLERCLLIVENLPIIQVRVFPREPMPSAVLSRGGLSQLGYLPAGNDIIVWLLFASEVHKNIDVRFRDGGFVVLPNRPKANGFSARLHLNRPDVLVALVGRQKVSSPSVPRCDRYDQTSTR